MRLDSLLGSTILRDAADPPGGGGGGDGGGGNEPPAPQRPSAFGDPQNEKDPLNAYWSDDAGIDYERLTSDFRDLSTFKSENAEIVERRAAVPEDLGEYKVELPESFKAPDGFTFNIAEDSPVLKSAREFAKAKGFAPDDFRELVGLQAQLEIDRAAGEDKLVGDAVEAEKNKLGDSITAQRRIDAVFDFMASLRGKGEDGKALDTSLRGAIYKADQIEELEKLVALAQKGGRSTFNGGGRNDDKPELSEEQYAAMSASDRINYARQAQGSR